MTDASEIILVIQAECGSLTLYRVRTKHGWSFSFEVIDSAPELIGEAHIQARSALVPSWEAALALLDKYPWPKLYPTTVHPEFQQQIWVAVKQRLQNIWGCPARELDRWQEICQS